MPVTHRLKHTLPANESELTVALKNEWQSPKASGQPLIVVEGGNNQPIHVYVIWDEWEGMNEPQRSEVIMDVMDKLEGEHYWDDLSLVTVAMGLTGEEASRMGISASP